LNEREHSPTASPAVLTFLPVPAARIGSLREFWKMWALRLTGRLDAELRRHDIEP